MASFSLLWHVKFVVVAHDPQIKCISHLHRGVKGRGEAAELMAPASVDWGVLACRGGENGRKCSEFIKFVI